MDLDTDVNTDFEENAPYQEGVISETYKRPGKFYIREPTELVIYLTQANYFKNSCQSRQI